MSNTIIILNNAHHTRNPVSGTWRAVKIVDDVLRPPDKGWADTVYIVVITPSKEVGGGQPEDDAERELGAAAGVQGSEKVDECDDDFSSMGYASDSYKRKLEDSEGQRASKNPRSHSPDNYVSFFSCLFVLCLPICFLLPAYCSRAVLIVSH